MCSLVPHNEHWDFGAILTFVPDLCYTIKNNPKTAENVGLKEIVRNHETYLFGNEICRIQSTNRRSLVNTPPFFFIPLAEIVACYYPRGRETCHGDKQIRFCSASRDECSANMIGCEALQTLAPQGI